MSVEQVYARIQELQSLALSAVDPAAAPPPAAAPGSGFEAALASAHYAALTAGAAGQQQDAAGAVLQDPSALAAAPAAAPAPPAATGQPAGETAGQRALAAAESQLGQAEQPPGSNDGPALSVYRSAVPGSQPGDPWCAEFVSWAAAQAGAPLGDGGQGFRSVADLTDWAYRTGRLLPAGATPSPGDLILFGDRHVGLVEQVNSDGSLETVEGNYSNAVTRVRRSPAEATGYVRI